MTRRPVLPFLVLLALLAACAAPTPTPTPTPTPAPTATPLPTAVPPTPTPVPTATPVAPPPYSLAEPGPYPVGLRTYLFRDPARNNKVVAIAIYYPALPSGGAAPGQFSRDAAPDLSGAPYPVLLAAAKEAEYFGIHLASYGLAFAGLDPQDNTPEFGPWLLNYPRDVIFALNQIAAGQLERLSGLLDPDHAGVFGYSFDSYSTLQMSGARIDPTYWQAGCATDAAVEGVLSVGWINAWGMCKPWVKWDEFLALAGESITRSDDDLWQPLAAPPCEDRAVPPCEDRADPRVRAVMPMGNDALLLFGPRGLAAIDRPTLVLESSRDEGYPIAAKMFEFMPQQWAAMITNIGHDHMILLDPVGLGHIRHLMVAFFGYHLLGRQEYAPLFSEEFVKQHPELAWGAYPPQ